MKKQLGLILAAALLVLGAQLPRATVFAQDDEGSYDSSSSYDSSPSYEDTSTDDTPAAEAGNDIATGEPAETPAIQQADEATQQAIPDAQQPAPADDMAQGAPSETPTIQAADQTADPFSDVTAGSTETPATETPATETPATETPATETPAAETPAEPTLAAAETPGTTTNDTTAENPVATAREADQPSENAPAPAPATEQTTTDSSTATNPANALVSGTEIPKTPQPLEDATYAQKTYSEKFSTEEGARFGGKTINDVADQLRKGELSPKDVPIEYARDAKGNTVMLNTRSAQALERAGIPRSEWSGVDVSNDPKAVERLNGQLERNGLGPEGTPTARSSTGANAFADNATREAAAREAAAANESLWSRIGSRASAVADGLGRFARGAVGPLAVVSTLTGAVRDYQEGQQFRQGIETQIQEKGSVDFPAGMRMDGIDGQLFIREMQQRGVRMNFGA